MIEHSAAAIVTGGARGIGRSIVETYAANGWAVAVLDLDGDGVTRAAAEVCAAGGTAVGIPVDLADRRSTAAAVERAARELGPISVLCNNAGVMDRMAPAHSVADEEWDRIFAINATAPFTTCRAVLPGMIERGRGAIVNIASIAGIAGGRAGAAYTASKHAVVGLTRSIAWTYAEDGIRCNAICPGSVATTIISDLELDRSDHARRVRKGSPQRPRVAEPAEIARVAAFLASDAASYVNGAVLPVDGAWTTC